MPRKNKKKEENEDRWDEEMDHLQSIMRSFFAYDQWNSWYVNELELDLAETQDSIQALIPGYAQKLQGWNIL